MRLPPWLWHFLASKRTHRALILAPFALMILATIAYVSADKWGEAKFEKELAQNPASLYCESEGSKNSELVRLYMDRINRGAPPPEVWSYLIAVYPMDMESDWDVDGLLRMVAIHSARGSRQFITEALDMYGSNIQFTHDELHLLPSLWSAELVSKSLRLASLHDLIISGDLKGGDLMSLQTKAALPNLQAECLRILSRQRAMTASMARETTQKYRRLFRWRQTKDNLWNAALARDHRTLGSELHLAWLRIQPEGMTLAGTSEYLKCLRENDPSCRTDGPTYFTFADFKKFDRADNAPYGANKFLWKLCKSTLEIQTSHNLLQCGIALERYRLKHGKHPESLSQLAPEFLSDIPRDACDGSPLRYRLNADGSAQVWSLWPSGKDVGGEPAGMHGTANWTWVTGKVSN